MKESIKILEELSGNIISENNLAKAVKIMSSKEIKDTIFNFLKLAEKDSRELSKDEMNFLKALIHVSNSIYNYSGENTGMSDSEYDTLLEEFDIIKRKEMIETIFLILEKNNIKSLEDFKKLNLDKVNKILNNVKNIDKNSKNLILKGIKKLLFNEKNVKNS